MNSLKVTTSKSKIWFGFAAIAMLLLCFSVTTYALIIASISVEENVFATGEIKINFNDSVPVITEEEFLFEPGMTVVKDFFIENESTIDVYYKIYLENVEGELAEILDVTLKEGEHILYQGKASDMTRANMKSPDDVLAVDDVRWFSLSFYYPQNGGNSGQSADMSFDVCAEAVQTVNNHDRSFN
ncbi:MAG: hypothetical protein IKA09_04580 [Lachnospiraceae bacterium]|nr:hypothetical protein [Lachnospiraceae bacterium]